MKLLKTLLLVFALTATSSLAEEKKKFMWQFDRIVDGDTISFKVDFLPPELGDTLSIRILGIDTPEKGFRAKCDKEAKLGEKATEYAKEIIDESKTLYVQLVTWDKFGGRVLGDVYVDGIPFSTLMIEKGYARPYDGKKKSDWCK